MQIYIYIFFIIASEHNTQRILCVVIFSVWTLKASDAFDKYLKLPFNPVATFFYLHQSIRRGRNVHNGRAQSCKDVQSLWSCKWKITSHLEKLIHGQSVFPAACWPAEKKNPCWNVFHHCRREPGLKISQPCPACFDDHLLSFPTRGPTLAEAERDCGCHLSGEESIIF